MQQNQPHEAAQPEVNIGIIGHVDHGKTTLVHALTGEWTDKHSEEIKRGITIRLGYADAAFRACDKCGEPERYTIADKCAAGHETKIARRVSFVDCPGHESLMAVTLSGAALMDGAILVIAANEPCPQPQTREHLNTLAISGIKNIVIVQNKVDLISKEQAKKSYSEIKAFAKGTVLETAPIVPVAAQCGANIDALIGAIESTIATPKRDPMLPMKLFVARSFDINKPGSLKTNELRGAVLGGSIIQGTAKVDDEIEIRPGIDIKGKYHPVTTKITSISTKIGIISEAKAGGLVALGTLLDPQLAKSDKLVGNIAGKPGTLPPVYDKLMFEPKLFEKTVNMQNITNIIKGETLVINAATATSIGTVITVKKNLVEIMLKKPICASPGDKLGISRKLGSRWGLIGYGIIR